MNIKFKCGTASQPGNTNDQQKRMADGKKFASGRAWMSDPQWECNMVIVRSLVEKLEHLNSVCFAVCPVGWNRLGKTKTKGAGVVGNNAQPRTVRMPHVVDESENVMSCPWSELTSDTPEKCTYHLAEILFPSCLPRSKMLLETIGCYMLLICQLCLRFAIRFSYPPYILLRIKTDQRPERALTDFMGCKTACCSNRVQPLRKCMGVDELGGSRRDRLLEALDVWEAMASPGTVPEERSHTEYRASNLARKVPSGHAKSASLPLARNIKSIWLERGGRDLTKAPSQLSGRYRAAITPHHVSNRKIQYGKPFVLGRKES